MIGRVCGTGSYLPIRTVSNDELSHVMETSDEWIRERTGIRFRHVALEETTSDMAAEAAARALKNGEVNADEIELILTATSSSDVIYPSAACIVQKRIGAQNALAFDLNGACSGFVIAFNTAQAYIRAGIYKTILVVGAESMSRLVDWSDRSTSVLFGDGAGALILKAEEGDHYWQTGHSDGTKDFVLTLRSKSLFEEQDDNPKDVLSKSDEGSSVEEHDDVSKNAEDISRKKKSHKTGICMDGQEVFKFAVRKVPELTEELLEKSGLKIADIDFFILRRYFYDIFQFFRQTATIFLQEICISSHRGAIDCSMVYARFCSVNDSFRGYHGEVYQSFYRCRIQNHFRTGNDKGSADRLSERSVGR